VELPLTAHWTDYLLTKPEVRPGEQLVDLTLADGRVIKRCLVVNCDTLFPPPRTKRFTAQDITSMTLTLQKAG
jgi:hypothetical protein